ncbi:spaetzle domain-containing protein [Trichonephila clavata]|uniref:Spaetzle domain-containing protein n=1 Tax=Trichonephila clavata TaxID=2740835 RepID=A0A8X6L570_TRICU|nr:spaetzle domain-containing protein [Trichonephila clavata]
MIKNKWFKNGISKNLYHVWVTFTISTFLSSICSANYATTSHPGGYWGARGGYPTSLTKGHYDTRRDSRYGAPPLGPQLPEPLPQKQDPFRPTSSRLDSTYLNQLPSDRPACARKRDYCLHDHDYPM